MGIAERCMHPFSLRETENRYTGALTGIFAQVHAPGKNNQTLFCCCGSKNLRCFLRKTGSF